MAEVKHIIQITGKVGAGKTSVCAHLAEKYDFRVVLVSDLIRDFAHSRNLKLQARADYLAVYKQMKVRNVFRYWQRL